MKLKLLKTSKWIERDAAYEEVRLELGLWDGHVFAFWQNGNPVQIESSHFSISHKDWICLIGISNKPIWVDIEFLSKRDLSLFSYFSAEEFNLSWKSDWEWFYILWTAKESIIKCIWAILDNMKEIALVSKTHTIKQIWNLNFTLALISVFRNFEFITYVWINDNLVYSVTELYEKI